MTNCLSSNKFANLLFVNVQIGDVRTTALFDTGAGMTVIAQSLLRRLRAALEKEILRAGNNNGVVRGLQTAVIPNIRLGDVCMENCKVLVTDDADFALSDESGRIFPAEMLLGWDVISRYRWSYSAKDESLSVSLPEKAAEHLSPEIKQGPIVYPEYAGRCFKARVDTGHGGKIMKNTNQLIGCCGLDCEKCDARIATLTNDNALREKTAALWTKLNGVTITLEMINCTGCRIEGAKTPFCDKLCPVHNCVREKKLATCADCGERAGCPTLGQIAVNSPLVLENLKALREAK